jgi:hypothetical protein
MNFGRSFRIGDGQMIQNYVGEWPVLNALIKLEAALRNRLKRMDRPSAPGNTRRDEGELSHIRADIKYGVTRTNKSPQGADLPVVGSGGGA